MSKKERIAELEQRVAALETQLLALGQRNFYLDMRPITCPICGASGNHICGGSWGASTVGTTTS